MRNFFKGLFSWYQLGRTKREKLQIDVILSSASSCLTYKDKINWLRSLFLWLRSSSPFLLQSLNLKQENLPSKRLKYLLSVLERNENWKKDFAFTFHSVLDKMSSLELFSEVGLSHEQSFAHEIQKRIFRKILIEGAPQKNLDTLIEKIFPNDSDVALIDSIEEDLLSQFINVLQNTLPETPADKWAHLHLDLEDAILFLVTQIRAQALRPEIRSRVSETDFRKLPSFSLARKADAFIASLSSPSFQQIEVARNELLELLTQSRNQVKEVYDHLDKYGVSVSIVFTIEQLLRQIERVEYLVKLRDLSTLNLKLIRLFLAQLIVDLHASRGILSFIWENIRLVMKKVVERNSEIGEHYIAENNKEYFIMIKKAAGGGALTAVTVLFKFLLMGLAVPQFLFGLFATVNYGISFLAIQFTNCTLATKQPASTAPTLAAKMVGLDNHNIEIFIDDLVRILRTQFAAVFGNIILVIPTILLIGFSILTIFGKPLASVEKSHHIIESVDLLGPSFIYAIFTGFLLFVSSIAAGWVDNWFAFHRISDRLSSNEKIVEAVGDKAARKVGFFFRHNISGIVGSISLAIFLGLGPEVLSFLGIPLDVRHVTLSTGAIFATIPTLGWQYMISAEFIRACLGIVVIGFFNVGISFLLALLFAVFAKDIRATRRNLIISRLASRLLRKPWSFFLPH